MIKLFEEFTNNKKVNCYALIRKDVDWKTPPYNKNFYLPKNGYTWDSLYDKFDEEKFNIVEYQIDLSNFIIRDEELAKRIYGHKYKIMDQVEYIMGKNWMKELDDFGENPGFQIEDVPEWYKKVTVSDEGSKGTKMPYSIKNEFEEWINNGSLQYLPASYATQKLKRSVGTPYSEISLKKIHEVSSRVEGEARTDRDGIYVYIQSFSETPFKLIRLITN